MRKLGCGPPLQLQRKIPSFKYLATWDNREMVWKDAESIFQRGFHGRRCCQILMSLIPVTACYRDSTHPIRSLILPFSGTGGGGGGGGLEDECGLFSQTVAGNRAWMNPTLQGLMSSWQGAGSKPHPQGWRTMSFVPQPARFSLLLFHRLTYHPSLHNRANSEKLKIIQIESFKKDYIYS